VWQGCHEEGFKSPRPDELPPHTEPYPRQLNDLLLNGRTAARVVEQPTLAPPLRVHARGLYSVEAAVEILIDHATWLRRNDFTTRFVHTTTNVTNEPAMASIDWPAAIASLDSGEMPCSGGDGRILRLAASLAEGIPVNLRDAVTGLDTCNIDILTKAVLHASGHRPST
jgi:hypothetical protein